MASRPGIISADLGDLKQSWLDWCESRGLTQSEALRQIVHKLTAPSAKAAKPKDELAQLDGSIDEGLTERIKISLKPSELAFIEARAAAEGMSPARWIVSLIRGRLSQTPQFCAAELIALAESQRELMSVGHQLSHIAKAVNGVEGNLAGEVGPMSAQQLSELQASIKAHVVVVSKLMTANIKRWSLQ